MGRSLNSSIGILYSSISNNSTKISNHTSQISTLNSSITDNTNNLQSQINTLNSNFKSEHFNYISITVHESFVIDIGNNNTAIAVATRQGTYPAVYVIYKIANKELAYKINDESNLISYSENGNLINITLNLDYTVFRYFVI